MPSFRDRLARANAQARASMAQIRSDLQEAKTVQRAREKEIRDDHRDRMETIKRDHRGRMDSNKREHGERLSAIKDEHRERQSASNHGRQQAEQDTASASAGTEEAAAVSDDVAPASPWTQFRSEVREANSELRERTSSIRGQLRQGSNESAAFHRAARLSAADGHRPGRVARMPIVRVAYCLLNEQPSNTDGYAYRWPFEDDPAIGDRVFVTTGGSQALEPAVIVAFGRDDDWSGHLKWVRRRATAKDHRRSQWLS